MSHKLQSTYPLTVPLFFASLLLCMAAVFSWQASQSTQKIKLSEEQLLIVTERAFLEGYRAALLQQNHDTVWTALSAEYHQLFQRVVEATE